MLSQLPKGQPSHFQISQKFHLLKLNKAKGRNDILVPFLDLVNQFYFI